MKSKEDTSEHFNRPKDLNSVTMLSKHYYNMEKLKDKVNLHLGCGKRHFPGWIHVDKADYKHIDHQDVTKFPLLDNKVDTIYASHLLEYFDREEVVPVLQEWNRVLKPEGELYLSVPDFGKMSELYQDKRVPLHKFLGPLYGKMECNEDKIFHKTVYDYASLGELLRFTGFKRIEPWRHKDLTKLLSLENSAWDDHSKAKINNQLISLNIRCRK